LIDQVPTRLRKLLFEPRMRNVDPFSIDSLSLMKIYIRFDLEEIAGIVADE